MHTRIMRWLDFCCTYLLRLLNAVYVQGYNTYTVDKSIGVSRFSIQLSWNELTVTPSWKKERDDYADTKQLDVVLKSNTFHVLLSLRSIIPSTNKIRCKTSKNMFLVFLILSLFSCFSLRCYHYVLFISYDYCLPIEL